MDIHRRMTTGQASFKSDVLKTPVLNLQTSKKKGILIRFFHAFSLRRVVE